MYLGHMYGVEMFLHIKVLCDVVVCVEWTDFYVDGETNVLQFGVGETKSTKAVIRIVDDYVCEGPESFSLQATIDSKTAQKVKLSAFDRLPITIIDNEGMRASKRFV